jgi:hypothetical protein
VPIASGTPEPASTAPGPVVQGSAIDRPPVAVVSSNAADDGDVLTAPDQPQLSEGPPRRNRLTGNGTLRIPVGLPRRRGVLGDLQYVYTVVLGVSRARRQLGEIDRLLDEAKTIREQRLAELGRQAASDGRLTLPAIEQGREQLYLIEEHRSQRSGLIAACDEELATLERERDEERTARSAELVAAREEIVRIRQSLEPLEKKIGATRRRAQRLGSVLGVLDEKITGQETGLAGTAADEAAATIASLRAERETIAAEEPALAAEIDDVEPKIASLRATRSDAEKRIGRLESLERDETVRTDEIRAAILARKAVEERAAADLVRAKDTALRELGERLYVDRPGELQRRLLELTDLVGAVNRRALARGVGWLALALLLVGALVAVVVITVL